MIPCRPAPRALADARAILADPARFAGRPRLRHLARLVLMSAAGTPERQAPPRRPTDARP